MTIREKWIYLRLKERFTIQEVSQRTGINRNTISLFERGLTNISSDNLEKMVKSLGAEIVLRKDI
jgi:transcriptional regulator with XRE-family HTH domain